MKKEDQVTEIVEVKPVEEPVDLEVASPVISVFDISNTGMMTLVSDTTL